MAWTLLLAVPAGLAAAGLIYHSIGTARDRRSCGAPGTLASAGRHRLHIRCEGSGSPTVVLEAGIAASSLTWSRVQPAIAGETRVCSYDRAGLAWSDGASTPRSIDTLVHEPRVARREAFGSIPVVVLSAGDRDTRWLAEDAALAAGSSCGCHIVSPRSGHWIHLDDPQLVVDAIRNVLRHPSCWPE